MKAAVMTGIKKIAIEERDIPEVLDNQVLVKIDYVGICGSDLHYYENGYIGDYKVEPPFVLGHESSGTIVEVSSQVTNLKIGDRVALEPGKTCGKCEFCKTGKYNLCPEVIFFATPPVGGVFQEYVAYDADLCFKLTENVTALEGAMIEPLSVGFHAANQGEAAFGQTAVVMGAGCIGLSTMIALKAKGVAKVYVADILQNRLDKAKELGATGIINVGETDLIKAVMDVTDGLGCDLAIETTGNENSFVGITKLVKKGATIVWVGYSKADTVSIPVNLALDKEITFKTVFRYRNIYKMAIEAVANGIADPGGIVTDVFEFKDIGEALDLCINNKAEIVKAVVKVSQ